MLFVLAMLAQVSLAPAVPAKAPALPTIRAVTATPTGTAVVISLQLSGPARPRAGRTLDNPLRLYFDLPGVLPGPQPRFEIGTGPISRARLALHKANPPVTRLVVDLTARTAWRLERGTGATEWRIVIEDAAPSSRPPAPAPGGRVIHEPVPPPVRDRREQITAEVFEMSDALARMRDWTGPSDAALVELMATLERLSTGARAMQRAGVARDAAIVAVIDAVRSAARARAVALADGSAQSRGNAIAAAEGALILLRHAQATKVQ